METADKGKGLRWARSYLTLLNVIWRIFRIQHGDFPFRHLIKFIAFEVGVRWPFPFSPPDVSSTVYFLAANLKEEVFFSFFLFLPRLFLS